MMDYIDNFQILNQIFIPRINSIHPCNIILFIYYSVLFATTLLRILVSIFMGDIALYLSLFVLSFSGCDIRVKLINKMNWEVFLLLPFYLFIPGRDYV